MPTSLVANAPSVAAHPKPSAWIPSPFEDIVMNSVRLLSSRSSDQPGELQALNRLPQLVCFSFLI